MKVDKLFNGLKHIANGDYVLEGDLISEETIEIDLDDRLVIKGAIKSGRNIVARWDIKAGDGIKAGESIKAGCGIEAGESIKAGCGIEAGWGIEAGDGIEAKTFINASKRIFAGISLYLTSKDCDKTIRCAELRNGEICYGDLTITENGGIPDEG